MTKGRGNPSFSFWQYLCSINYMLKRIRLSRMFRFAPLLAGLFTDFPALVRLVKESLTGNYKDLSKKAVLKILFAVCYVFFFVDLIPDFIPFAGWIDDIVVLTWVVGSLKEEIESFRRWEAAK